jgi:hypothetical protein
MLLPPPWFHHSLIIKLRNQLQEKAGLVYVFGHIVNKNSSVAEILVVLFQGYNHRGKGNFY